MTELPGGEQSDDIRIQSF